MPLNWEQVKEALNNVFNYLNTIDLQPYLKEFKQKRVRDMMDKLEENYLYIDKYSENLFDVMHEEEFVNYLNKRYKLNVRETTVSYYYI